jgi:hypothetical protein
MQAKSLHTLVTVHQKKITCDRTHIVAFTDKQQASRAASLLEAPRSFISSSGCYLESCSVFKQKFEKEMKPELVKFGLCPDRLEYLEARPTQVIVHKNDLPQDQNQYVLVKPPEICVDSIHPYTLFSMTVHDFVPIAIIGELLVEKDDHLAYEALMIDNTKKRRNGISLATSRKQYGAGGSIDPHQSGFGFFLDHM